MSAAAITNAAILAQLALETALRLAEYNRVMAQAAREGRDVTDEEIAQARLRAVAALDGLAVPPAPPAPLPFRPA